MLVIILFTECELGTEEKTCTLHTTWHDNTSVYVSISLAHHEPHFNHYIGNW